MRLKKENLIFYQIYPKSFCDSDGDGVGDIGGILSKIEYIKNLGVNAVWLTPCYASPEVDNGYDISDYYAIAEKYGGTKKMETLIEKFHENGIAVVLDFVANHTSTAHPWFQAAKKSKDNPYRDYYIWRAEPNEWQSIFGGTAWEFDGKTGEYYLHSFAVEQADLNWDNPRVRKEMRAVIDFWIAKGVDGFRCDVLDMISKDFEKGENGSGPRLHEYIRELFGREETDRLFTVGECWSANAENARAFCEEKRKELTTVFAFDHLCVENGRFSMEKPALQELCKRLSEWQISMRRQGLCPTVFLENHDQPRSVSRFADDGKYRYESATLLGGLTLLHYGIPFLYQGQEIGMTNSRHESLKEFNDVETCNYARANFGKLTEKELLDTINAGSRDNARRPIPWDGKDKKSWITPYSRRREINVSADFRAEKSVYSFYRALIALRKEYACLTQGAYERLELNETRYIFRRWSAGEEIIAAFNFEKPSSFTPPENAKVLLDNYGGSAKRLQPYRCIVFLRKS